MSKAIRWQVPFASISGTKYRVDIYDEGYTGTPVQLLAGEQPFVTEEDSSEDFFAPLRTQTGTLQVCTALPDGGRISLDELLPANNIARPIRLINLDNSNAIEWQGFLSCEAYSQNYTAIPENLSLPVISVLEAMDSVEIQESVSRGFTTIKSAIKTAIDYMMTQSGISFYTHVNYSGNSYRIFNKYIDQSVFYEQKEYNDEGTITYDTVGISVKEVMSRLATYMGWTVREQGTVIYFERLGQDIYTWTDTYAEFGGANPSVQQTNFTTINISDMIWHGTNHQRSIAQGAKSVEVIAKVGKNDFRLSLPSFPYRDPTTEFYKRLAETDSGSVIWKYVFSVLEKDRNAYSNITYSYYHGTLERTGDSQYTAIFRGLSDKQTVLANMYLRTNGTWGTDTYAGAFLAKYALQDKNNSLPSYNQGLYCSFLPGLMDVVGTIYPIFSMQTPKTYVFNNGAFNIKSDMYFIGLQRYNSIDQPIITSKINDDYLDTTASIKLRLSIRDVFTNTIKYWNGSDWTNSQADFEVEMSEGNGFDINIPVETLYTGRVTLEVLPFISIDGVNTVYESIFKSLDVTFVPNSQGDMTDRGENHYFATTGENYRDEIAVTTDLASNMHNAPSPTLIMNSETEPMTTLDYTTSGSSTTAIRPETDLLDRLLNYYSYTRQTLDLIITHPTSAALPLLKMNGISDGKVYVPLSESRDWRDETCTLKCFENIN